MNTNDQIKVFLLDDDEDDFIIVEDLLSEVPRNKFHIDWESDFNNALEKLRSEDYDICLVDYRLGEHNGLDFIKSLQEHHVDVPVILLTGQGDSDVDFEAMELGVHDYLVKGQFDSSLLSRSIRYAISHVRSTQELNASEEKYRSLFERSVDTIYLINKEHRFIDVNNSIENLLGFTKDEILNKCMKDVFANENSYVHFNEMLVKKRHIKDFEATLLTKEKKERDCIINGIALRDENDNVYAFQGIIHDLTARKRAEKELLVAEKLAMTGQIARSMAHEIRNPLTNLNLALEQLRDEIPDNDDSELFFDIIKRNASRIEQLITDMLKSSKPRDLDLAPQQLNNVIEETLAMTSDRLKLREIKLEKNLDQNLPDINIDNEQLKVALINIVINAIEAMEESKGVLKINSFLNNEYAGVSISDNGHGIPKDQIQKLFDPFFTGKKGGMGLGLTSTRNILNSHKAQVDVHSELNKGTIFTIKFKL